MRESEEKNRNKAGITTWIKSLLYNNGGKKYYAVYTCFFLMVCLGVYIWFLCGRRTFIWHADGWNEYYKALVYYAQYLRSIIRELIHGHGLVVPNWDFSIGEGSDVLQTLQCFGIGDPIVALSVFVPADYLYIFYSISALFRLYLAGAAFSALCFKLGNRNSCAVLAGAMAYVFSHWGIYHVSVHPYFITPMICLPLLILGIEKIIHKESPLFFSIAVFLSAVSNFYFFYMLVLLTVIYVLVRLLYLYRKDIKRGFGVFLNIGWSALLGVGLSAVILAPVCYTFLDNDRVGGAGNFRHLFYPLQYYSQLAGVYLSKENTYSLHMGFAVPVLFATCLLFIKKKKYTFLKILFAINIAFIILPVFGQVFNGFSYMSDRWCFAFTLLSAYILTALWSSLAEVDMREIRQLFFCVTGYFAICMLSEYSRRADVFSAVALCYILLSILMYMRVGGGTERTLQCQREAAIFGILLISVLHIGFWRNSSAEGAADTAAEGVETAEAGYQVLKMNEASAIRDYAEITGKGDGFYRYSGRSLTKNAGQLSGMSSTQYYYSFSNPYISKYRKEMELLETGQSFSYTGYDDRPFLMSLASVLYYAAPFGDSAQLPYGLWYVSTPDVRGSLTREAEEALKMELGSDELSERQEAEIRGLASSWWDIYENQYFLPLAYTYDSYIPDNTWKNLSAVEKQEAMLETVYLDDVPASVKEEKPELNSRSVPFEITCNSTEISMHGNTFVATAPNASVTLEFDGLPDCETYFSIRGLEFKGVSEYELYFGDETVDPYNIYNRTGWNLLSYDERKRIKRNRLFGLPTEETWLLLNASNGSYNGVVYKTQDYMWYSDRHDFTADLSYSEEAVKTITITFQQRGIYQFDEMEIRCQPMDGYRHRIDALKEYTEGRVRVGNDSVSGVIDADTPKMLCFSIPYSDGWKAYVDGVPVKLYHANVAYMAIEIGQGEHCYELVYETPLLRIGIYVSVACLIIFCIIFMIEKWKLSPRR